MALKSLTSVIKASTSRSWKKEEISRKKEIMKIIVEIHEIENRKTV